MDGYEATREIRRNPAWAGIPIVAMTANAMAGDKEKVLAAGMVDHVAKPLVVSKMFETLARWIKPGRPVAAAATPVPAAESDGLPEVTGIDTKAGLATVMGNSKLYRRLLLKFRDANEGFAGHFAAAQADADAGAAIRVAHTLKGTAGNIGARGIAAAAGELEHACKSGQPAKTIEGLLAKTVAELEPVIRALSNVRAEEAEEKPPAAKADPAEVRKLITTIITLADNGDADAADAVEKLADLVKGTILSPSVDRISGALEDYDFDAALDELRKLETV